MAPLSKRILTLLVLAALLPFLTGATIVIRGPRVPAAGGSPAWTDTIASGSTDTNVLVPTSGEHWTDITLPTGTASKLRMYIRSYGYTGTLKMGLHDNSGNLLQSGTVSVTTTGYFEITITNQSVTSGNYKVSWVTDSGGSAYAGYQNSVGLTYWASGGSSNTLFDPLPTPGGTDTRTVAIGVYITP
jgi:hypothetical protein